MTQDQQEPRLQSCFAIGLAVGLVILALAVAYALYLGHQIEWGAVG